MLDVNDQLSRDTQFGFIDGSVEADKIFNPLLISNHEEDTMLKAILHELSRSHSFTWSVAFITPGAVAMLKQALLEYGGQGTIITSNYLDFNEPDMFRELLDLENIDVRIHENAAYPFHAKGYVFHHTDSVTVIVGSSNLTRNALVVNNEWNLRFSAMPDGDITLQLSDTLDRQKLASIPLTDKWIEEYANTRTPQQRPLEVIDPNDRVLPVGRIVPNDMQAEALDAISSVWDSGERRAVVVSATGTGKTILAALAVRQAQPQRLLFLVHREQILDKAITEFQRVLDADVEEFGKFVGATREIERKYVFSTVQSLSREDHLKALDPAAFDFVIIDEVHRAGASGYQRIINHLQPERLLGLTATPERTDGYNIYELFDYNVPYEIRLQKALEENMLVPFNYYGVSDFVDATGETISETSKLGQLVAPERVSYLVQMLERYGHKSDVRGLMFCSSKGEAEELSSLLNEQFVNGRQLRTTFLTGDDSMIKRNDTVARLERGQFDYILTVDIFNEGIDIPSINQVVMLRNTQSSIVFTQQLGRGLRKAEAKDHLRVIDFIGNYSNNFMIPIALFGDSSLNKYNIRQKVLKARANGSIAGVSTVNFDAIARERVLNALSKVNLNSVSNLKSSYLELEQRLGRQPMRIDFARYDTVDPVIITTLKPSGAWKPHHANYWCVLNRFKKFAPVPSDAQSRLLTYFDNELLNGKRPHELLLLQELLGRKQWSRHVFQQFLAAQDLRSDEAILNSVERYLTLDYFTKNEQNKYGTIIPLKVDGTTYSLTPEFVEAYSSSEVLKSHIDDAIETGLFISRHKYGWSSDMVVGEQYTRKDACRMLNFINNEYSTLYGYKVDKGSNSCPIFVTYHKDENISASTKYADAFDDPSTLQWATRSGVTLASPAEQPIFKNSVPLHVFVKKGDFDGKDYLYLGKALSRDHEQHTMNNDKGEVLPVVHMKLDLEHALTASQYDFFVSPPIEFNGAETKINSAASDSRRSTGPHRTAQAPIRE